ncbi:MAG: ABC transporter substrate-binding protein [Acidimicrobiales bacterium]|jgi:peptide/nickel transport system substrate-binding protein
MTRRRKLGRLATTWLMVASVALVLAGFGASPKQAATTGRMARLPRLVRVKGGTLTVAEAAADGPDYIFPMMGESYFFLANLQLVYLLYRPLYWFGTGTSPELDKSLSLAAPPLYAKNGRSVTIDMKGYKWSDGENVDARDVVFWMNMLKADATSWGGYVPGAGQFPGDVTNVVADELADTVTFSLNAPYSPYWFTYDELSQVTPLPIAWDITSASAKAGSGGCSGAPYASITTSVSPTGVLTPVSASAKACAGVYDFLTGKTEAADLGTLATNPLWKIVDGPFSLASFDATDFGATLVPNRAYTGPVKSSLDKLVLVPFATNAAEYEALKNGGTIDVGYVEPAELPTYTGPAFTKSGQTLAGRNDPALAASYNLDPAYLWAVNYFALNYTNPAAGPIFEQTYVRRAMQSLMNQTGWVQAFDAGYGAPTYGPVPVYPPTDLLTPQESSNPYPYDPAHARALLRSHGWKVMPGGVSTCAKPGTASGECGANIAKGAPLSFDYLYYAGNTSFVNEVKALAATWEKAGIHLDLEGSTSFDGVITTAATPCSAGNACDWGMANWDGGWDYSPDYYPTGEQLFSSGAGSNFGDYSDATADRLIAATRTSPSLDSLYSYENYIARQVPEIWQPETTTELKEVAKDVCGFTPQNPLFTWVAEDWYFCKS